MPVNVLYPRDPSNFSQYWETDWLHELFPPTSGFRHVQGSNFFEDHTIIIINNPTDADFEKILSEYQKRGLSYGLIHLSDEFFRHNRACYNNAKVVFRNCYSPTIDLNKVMFFPLGYKMGFWKDYDGPSPLDVIMKRREFDWSFAGALKSDRKIMLQQMKTLSENNYVHFNSSWNTPDSLSTKQYRNVMLNSKLIPSGLGNMNIDCFRIYEALESGCIPIVVQRTPHQNFHYLEKLFGGPTPIPTVIHWKDVNQYQSLLTTSQGEELRQTIYQWWVSTKDRLKSEILRRCQEAFPNATWTNGSALPNLTIVIAPSQANLKKSIPIVQSSPPGQVSPPTQSIPLIKPNSLKLHDKPIFQQTHSTSPSNQPNLKNSPKPLFRQSVLTNGPQKSHSNT